MKKILVVLIAMVTISTSLFANEKSEYDVFNKLNNTVKLHQLARFIDADSDQENQLKLVFKMTQEKINAATASGDASKLENAVKFNISNANHMLSAEQYKKYIVFVNLSRLNMNEELASIK